MRYRPLSIPPRRTVQLDPSGFPLSRPRTHQGEADPRPGVAAGAERAIQPVRLVEPPRLQRQVGLDSCGEARGAVADAFGLLQAHV